MSTQTRKAVLIAGSGLVLVFAAWRLIFHGSAEAQFPTHWTARGVDLATGKEVTLRVPLGSPPPWEGQGGQRTVYPWFFCRGCRSRLVPEPLPAFGSAPARLPVAPVCPKCGSGEVVRWQYDDPDQAQPAGDLALPRLKQNARTP